MRLWKCLLAVLLIAGSAWGQHSFTTRDVQIGGAGIDLILLDDSYLYYGTAGPIRARWNTGTSKLEWSDGTNVLMSLEDAGTTGTLAVSGIVTVGSVASIRGGSGISLTLGSNYTGDGLTNSVQKVGRLGVPHYLSAEEPVGVFHVRVTDTSNEVYIGGGTPLMNTATNILFRTAADTTTTTGTNRLTIDSAGLVRVIQNLQVDGDVAVNGGDITSSAATMNVFNTTNTTVNFAGEATALTMGASASGTTTIRNRLATSNIVTFTANDTTPSVKDANIFKVPGTWTAGNNITALDDGVAGQVVRIIGGDSDCTFVDGGNLKLAGNWTAAADDTLVVVSDGTNWYELDRSDN